MLTRIELDNCDCREENRWNVYAAEHGTYKLSVCLECGRVYFPKDVIAQRVAQIKAEVKEAEEQRVREAQSIEERRQFNQCHWERQIERAEYDLAELKKYEPQGKNNIERAEKDLAELKTKKERGEEAPPSFRY